MCYSRMGVEAESFRNTVPTAGTSQATLGSGNPLCDGFLLSSNAHLRLSTKPPFLHQKVMTMFQSPKTQKATR